MHPGTERVRTRGLVAVLVGLLALWSFHLIGERLFNGYELDLGSRFEPRRVHMYFLSLWMFFGLIATAAITAGLMLGAAGLVDRVQALGRRGSDRAWILGAAALALVVPLAIRLLVLEAAPVTDDEGTYRFISELIAQGRLTAESPPEKLFFDRQFMINDGRYYGMYFVGWPALRAPFVLIGLEDLANPFYAAMTVPPLFLVVRRLAGSTAARLSSVIYVTAPMLMIGAATDLSHTSCLAALAWLILAVLRSREDGRLLVHASVAVAFSIAFFIRPISAVGVGLPLLIYWAIGAARLEPGERWRAIAAMGLPALGFGAAFLAVNWIQHGSPLETGYAASLEYTIANQFRFTTWNLQEVRGEVGWHGTELVVSNLGLAVFRISGAAFGWPVSLLLIPLAIGARGAGLIWASAGFYFLVHVMARSIGVDAFGPAHYVEVLLPILILTGIAASGRRLAEIPELRRLKRAPAVTAVVMVAIGFLLYTPTRLASLSAMVRPFNQVVEAVETADLDDAVVFVGFPFTPPCARSPTDNTVYWWPPNSPDFDDDVLWANHVDLAADQKMLDKFPGRRGYVLLWNRRCEPEVRPIAEVSETDAPPNPMARPRYSDARQ